MLSPVVSEGLRRAIFERRFAGERQHEIARRAGLHPTLASAILCGARPIRRNDPRVAALARAVGYPVDKAIDYVEVRRVG